MIVAVHWKQKRDHVLRDALCFLPGWRLAPPPPTNTKVCWMTLGSHSLSNNTHTLSQQPQCVLPAHTHLHSIDLHLNFHSHTQFLRLFLFHRWLDKDHVHFPKKVKVRIYVTLSVCGIRTLREVYNQYIYIYNAKNTLFYSLRIFILKV